ncbi:hypothetical protein FACS189485_13710 [Spirochaetia bacterium]|nr:hypothetical protein FACS189485_13710 [Spirochaetia bacterium]
MHLVKNHNSVNTANPGQDDAAFYGWNAMQCSNTKDNSEDRRRGSKYRSTEETQSETRNPCTALKHF